MGNCPMQAKKAQNVVSATPARYRMLGWVRRRSQCSKSAIWFRFDAKEFSQYTGLSIRAVRYALNQLRDDPDRYGFHWRTVFNRARGLKGSWEVLFAASERLKWDREPLFRDREGKDRHIRKGLNWGIIKPNLPQKPRSECNPYKGRDTSYLSREYTPRRGRDRGEISPEGRKRLWAKAAAMARRLKNEHWDNCKVEWEFHSTRKFCFWAIFEGFEENQIREAYGHALTRFHATATDIKKIFNPSSTAKRARKFLVEHDGSRRERIPKFYAFREKLRKMLAETFIPLEC